MRKILKIIASIFALIAIPLESPIIVLMVLWPIAELLKFIVRAILI